MIGFVPTMALEACEGFFQTGYAEVGSYLLHNPAITIFLCLGIGYWLGKLTIKSFTVGATVGTLLAGLVISFVFAPLGAFDVPGLVKSIFFTLFIFTIGYEVGPAFVRSIKKNGVPVIILSVFFAVVAFVACFVLFKAFNVAPGEAAGIIAGALTQSAVLGTASETIRSSMHSAAQTQALAQLPIAYAITYVFGTAGLIIFMKDVAPRILGVNLKAATAKKIADSGFKEASHQDVVSSVKARAFTVNAGSALIGKTIAELEAQYPDTMSVEQLLRKGALVSDLTSATIAEGDILTCIGNLSAMVGVEANSLTELSDEKYLKIALSQKQVVLTHPFQKGDFDALASSGIVVAAAEHDGVNTTDVTNLVHGDCITLVGPKAAVTKAIKSFGYAKDTGSVTDVSFMSFGIVVGLIIGALCITAGSVPITLGGGGGALVGGLIFGWYQDKHANYGLIPTATRWFLKSVGLNLFIAVVGLMCGAHFISAIQHMGVVVLVLGVFVTLIPHILSCLFGRFVLKMDPVDIIGGLCGAGTCTAALNGVIDETGSSVFALGYTPGYAVGNMLITVLGPLMVSVLLI